MGLITGLLVGLSALTTAGSVLEQRKQRKDAEKNMAKQEAAAEAEANRESMVKSREADITLDPNAPAPGEVVSLAAPAVKKRATKTKTGALASTMTGGLR